jgi:hypothetical protein
MRIRRAILPAIAAMGTAGFVLAGSAAASASVAPAGLWQPNLRYHTSAPAAPKAVRGGPKHCFCFNGPKAVHAAPQIVPANEWLGPKAIQAGPKLKFAPRVIAGPKAIQAGPKLKFAPRVIAGPKAIQAGPKLKFAPRLH